MNSDSQSSFVDSVTRKLGWDESLERALELVADAPRPDKSRPSSIDVAKRVLESGSDREAVIATLLSAPGLRDRLDYKSIESEFGRRIAQL
ncbi:MAG TPA: hypothetical protein VKB27_21805, partial [Gammaproteobacteria bacterium]|nr:hypothetical protein [Gammaproteobacteria bacterium]